MATWTARALAAGVSFRCYLGLLSVVCCLLPVHIRTYTCTPVIVKDAAPREDSRPLELVFRVSTTRLLSTNIWQTNKHDDEETNKLASSWSCLSAWWDQRCLLRDNLSKQRCRFYAPLRWIDMAPKIGGFHLTSSFFLIVALSSTKAAAATTTVRLAGHVVGTTSHY